jgi:hypothetical protein
VDFSLPEVLKKHFYMLWMNMKKNLKKNNLHYFTILVLFMGGCLSISLPNRDLCKKKWENHEMCVGTTGCPEGQRCASHKFLQERRCVPIDCCDPWAEGPILSYGGSWCTFYDR